MNIINILRDLSGNNITRVEAWFFDGTPNIVTLYLHDNNISFVSDKTFRNLSQLSILDFKMFCGCNDNIPLWKWLTVSKKLQKCMGCYDYIGLYLEDLHSSDFYHCSEGRSTPSTTTGSTTSTRVSTTTMTITSAARITRKKLDATIFDSRVVIGIAIGAGSLAGVIVLLFVICRLWIRSKDKEDKLEPKPDKVNSMTPAIPQNTFPQRPTEKSQFII